MLVQRVSIACLETPGTLAVFVAIMVALTDSQQNFWKLIQSPRAMIASPQTTAGLMQEHGSPVPVCSHMLCGAALEIGNMILTATSMQQLSSVEAAVAACIRLHAVRGLDVGISSL